MGRQTGGQLWGKQYFPSKREDGDEGREESIIKYKYSFVRSICDEYNKQ